MAPSNPSVPAVPNAIKLRISNIRADNVPIVGFRTGRFFVRATIDDDADIDNTGVVVANAGCVSWDTDLHLDATPSSRMRITLLATHRVRHETIVGWHNETLDAALWSTGPLRRRLVLDRGTPSAHIQYNVELLSLDAPCAAARRPWTPHAHTRDFDGDIAAGIRNVMRAAVLPVHTLDTVQDTEFSLRKPDHDGHIVDALSLGAIEELSEPLEVLLKHVDWFTKLVSKFAEIHPYAKFAYSVLTMAHTVVMAQKERDNNLRDLINVTSDVFAFLKDLKALKKHEKTIKLLTLQTAECAYFIRDYTKQKSFLIRTGTALLSGSAINDKIAGYKTKFQDLKRAFLDDSALHIEIIVLRIAEQIDRLTANGQLDDLPYASGARFNLGKQCLVGTREVALERIYSWANESEPSTHSQRVMILSGAAGTGKSAIAHTVSHRFNELRRLGSSFFFSASHPERSADKLFSTVTRDLADLDVEWRETLTGLLTHRALRKTECIREQFEEFILKPARCPSLVYFGPVVIVIDALDAVSDQEARQSLVFLLSSRIGELPRNFRILITTRPGNDICNAFENNEDVAWLRMDEVVDAKSNLKDIEEFFDNELDDRPGLKWNDRTCRKLSHKSEGDFSWAVTACSFIKSFAGSPTPSDRLSQLLFHPKNTPVSVLEAEDPASDSEREDSFHKHHIREMLAGQPSIILSLPSAFRNDSADTVHVPNFPTPLGPSRESAWLMPEPDTTYLPTPNPGSY